MDPREPRVHRPLRREAPPPARGRALLTRGDAGGRPLDVLVLSKFDGTDATSIADFLFAFNAYSRHRFFYVFDLRRLGRDVDLEAFDVVLVFWNAPLLGPDFGDELRDRLRAARALKVVFLQDEFIDIRRLDAALAQAGAQVLFTCAAERDFETFYPAAAIPTLLARHTVLPSYVPEPLAARRPVDGRRPIDLGYRSRQAPFYLGDLARAKRTIADRFDEACRRRGLKADISVVELARLYGAAWVRFLSSCRCVLGSPSGASVIDFGGEVRKACERHLARYPEAAYEEIRERYFAHLDGRVKIDTVSARVFEAAAMGCTLVQVAGDYGGVLEPGRHYVPIAPDLSNTDEVLDRVADAAYCRRMAETTHRELVASGRYSFRTFVSGFDDVLSRHAPRPAGRAPGRPAFYARRALRHRQPFVPAGTGYLVLPIHGAFVAWLLRSIPTKAWRPGPLAGRLLRNPGGFVRKLSTLAGIAARSRGARGVLSAWRGAPAVRSRIPLWQLLEDLLKLDVASRAIAGTLRSPVPFAVTVAFESESGTLVLASEPEARRATRPGEGPGEAVRAGRVRQVVWDHSELGLEVTTARSGSRWTTLSLGSGGVYRFAALSTLCREAPTLVAEPLLSLVDPVRPRPPKESLSSRVEARSKTGSG